MKKVIFVCHGNICRSPMAEFIFKKMVKEAGRMDEFEISSAAVSSEEIGNDIYPPAKRTLNAHNVPFERHWAHKITAKEFDEADVVVLMDASNRRLLAHIVGDKAYSTLPVDSSHIVARGENGSLGKVSHGKEGCHSEDVHQTMVINMLPDGQVEDPWYTGDFEKAYSDILRGCRLLLNSL